MFSGGGTRCLILGSGGGIRFNTYPKERMMLRIDYARGNSDGYFYFSINEVV